MSRRLYLGSQAVTPVVTVEKTVVPNYIAPKNNVNGVYKADNTATSFSLNGATDVEEYALYNAFYNCTNLTSVDLSSLTTVSGSNAITRCFSGCANLTSIDLSSLTTVSGTTAMEACFKDCTSLASVDLSSLTTVSGINSLYDCFNSCANLTSVDLSSLTTISGSNAITRCFFGCTNLTSIDLSSLTTLSGNSAMGRCFWKCTGLTTVRIGRTTAIDFGTRVNQFDNMFSDCNQASGIDLYIATTQEKLSTFTGYPSFGATCEVRIHYTAE